MNKTHIHIIKTGGTIEFKDPGYENVNTQMMKLDTSIDTYLKNMVKPHFAYTIESVCEKDSRDVTDEDRNKLINAIEHTSHSNIVITHGTYTMGQTAKYLNKHFIGKDLKKKIILTGSMIPVVGFSMSDAAFNLGYCMASFDHLKPGVYISMNGGIFKPNEVEKNSELLRFE
ncbi:MAG: asparaginase domain-containing protein [Patescibacteria group bacterium]